MAFVNYHILLTNLQQAGTKYQMEDGRWETGDGSPKTGDGRRNNHRKKQISSCIGGLRFLSSYF
jgi:hypothetical protein